MESFEFEVWVSSFNFMPLQVIIMPARANIVVNDGATTPVAHTFNPSVSGEIDLFEDKATGIAIGFPVIMVRFRRPVAPAGNGAQSTANSRVYRIELSLAYPTLEVTSPSTGTGIQPAPTVAYVNRVNSTWLHPERSTTQNRKDLHALFYNTLNNANVKSVLIDLEAFW